ARTGLRVRGADLVPRRDGRPADARVPAGTGRVHPPRGRDRRGRARPRDPRGMAAGAAGRRPAGAGERPGRSRGRPRALMAAEAPGALAWVGHSTVLVELDGARVLTDPVLRRRVGHLRRAEAVEPAALAPVDLILISHVHWDHLDLPSLEALGHDTRVVVPRGAGSLLERRGFTCVVE